MKTRRAICAILSATFALIAWGQTFTISPEEGQPHLRHLHLSHYDHQGQEHIGELICNAAIAQDIIDIFRELHKARYPIERMRPIQEYDNDDEKSMSANNTSCYCYRTIAGTRKLSKHATGMAIDINPRLNPCVNLRTGNISPRNGAPYAHKRQGPGVITRDDLCYRLFIKHGFKWGGAWRNIKDYQHFEK